MAKILALDTSTHACSAALLLDDQVHERFEVVPRRHTEVILPMIAELLKEQQMELTQLDAIGFAAGPGSFMGVRLATGVAQGLAFGANLPVVPISTLQALAQVAYDTHGVTQVVAAWDARMQEIYWGVYQLANTELMEKVIEDSLSAPENILLPESANVWLAAGNAWEAYKSELSRDVMSNFQQIDATLYPRASAVAYLAAHQLKRGKTLSAMEAEPIYLRERVTG